MRRFFLILVAAYLILGTNPLWASNEIINGSFDEDISSPWVNDGFIWDSGAGYAFGSIGASMYQVFQEPDWNPDYNQKIWSARAFLDVNGPGLKIETNWYYNSTTSDSVPSFSFENLEDWNWLGGVAAMRTNTVDTFDFTGIGFSDWTLDAQPKWMAVSIQVLPTETSSSDNFLGAVNEVTFEGECVGEPVPEPATMLLFGSGLVGLAGLRRRFRKI